MTSGVLTVPEAVHTTSLASAPKDITMHGLALN
jgi:hypothetical protein